MKSNLRKMVLIKGEHTYIFRDFVGNEDLILQQFAEFVYSPELNFDFYDAAVLTLQMRNHLPAANQDISSKLS